MPISKTDKLHYELSGKDKKYTLIFEAGLGDGAKVWEQTLTGKVEDSALPKLEKLANVFRYSRKGQGFSAKLESAAPVPAMETVYRLKKLLEEEGVEPPYILVGHSIGGLYMQFFAEKYPETVAGVVLIDPCANEQMDPKFLIDHPDWIRKIERETAFCGLWQEPITAALCESLAQREHYSKNYRFPSKIPLHVISAAYYNWSNDKQDLYEHKKQMHRWHEALAKQSHNSLHEKSGKFFIEDYNKNPDLAHYPHLFEPDILVNSVSNMINAVENKSSLQENSQHQNDEATYIRKDISRNSDYTFSP